MEQINKNWPNEFGVYLGKSLATEEQNRLFESSMDLMIQSVLLNSGKSKTFFPDKMYWFNENYYSIHIKGARQIGHTISAIKLLPKYFNNILWICLSAKGVQSTSYQIYKFNENKKLNFDLKLDNRVLELIDCNKYDDEGFNDFNKYDAVVIDVFSFSKLKNKTKEYYKAINKEMFTLKLW